MFPVRIIAKIRCKDDFTFGLWTLCLTYELWPPLIESAQQFSFLGKVTTFKKLTEQNQAMDMKTYIAQSLMSVAMTTTFVIKHVIPIINVMFYDSAIFSPRTFPRILSHYLTFGLWPVTSDFWPFPQSAITVSHLGVSFHQVWRKSF